MCRINSERRRAWRANKKKLAVALHFQRTQGWTKEHYNCPQCIKQELYKHRNCKKYPEITNPDYQWIPEYLTSKDIPYYPEDVSCNECPVSYITAESLALIQLDNRQRTAKEATGAMMYGPDLSRWPSRIVEACNVIEAERNNAENAKYKAEYASDS